MIRQVYGDSVNFDFSPYHGVMDVVFIDGAHTADYVKNDTEKALKMLRPEGGLMIWHDGPLYGVVKYLGESIREHGWPLQLIEGTTLMIRFVRNGQIEEIPHPLLNKVP